MNPGTTFPLFDRLLAERGLALDAILTGGAALALLGIINRETRDCDLLEPELTPELQEAARQFATEQSGQGHFLRNDWLNNGPSALVPLLPGGWRTRLQPIYQGRAIRLWALGRPELLLTKLWALCDRALDLGDCLALGPDLEELAWAEAWIVPQDLNPEWPQHVRSTLQDLAQRLGHGV
ncbi:MAG: hypothetical protein HGA66_13625 [Holophaga sp.]|nr:hypothetical protein [Holophaga sp.]